MTAKTSKKPEKKEKKIRKLKKTAKTSKIQQENEYTSNYNPILRTKQRPRKDRNMIIFGILISYEIKYYVSDISQYKG